MTEEIPVQTRAPCTCYRGSSAYKRAPGLENAMENNGESFLSFILATDLEAKSLHPLHNVVPANLIQDLVLQLPGFQVNLDHLGNKSKTWPLSDYWHG